MTLDAPATRALPAPPFTVGEAIAFVAERQEKSLRAVSNAAGLSDAAVQKIVSGASQPSLRTFARIVCALGLSPMEVYVLIANEARSTLNHSTGGSTEPVTPPEENGET